jgi:thymidylate synthase
VRSRLDRIVLSLVDHGKPVQVDDWQALDVSDQPQGKTIELLNVSFQIDIPEDPLNLSVLTEATQPWAERHFQERVSGQPLNPGEEYKNWPWYAGKEGQGVEEHKPGGKFSHTYMERFWAKHAGDRHRNAEPVNNWGIRYPYGDLNDLVNQLREKPYTRQAYLPVWFPEDTGAAHGERVPCTLGYHFILRDGSLHMVYFIRSCDAVRHLRNDVYLAGRLLQWVLEQLRPYTNELGEFMGNSHDFWMEVKPGTLTMHITSLHCFEAELSSLRRRLETQPR